MAINFTVKKLVTVPLLKVPDTGVPVYVKVTSAIFQAKDTNGKTVDASGVKQKPPMLAHVINLETGEVQQIIVGTVLESELKEGYPDDKYVGLSFEIKKHKPTGAKKYAMYQISEIEVTAEEAPTKAAKK